MWNRFNLSEITFHRMMQHIFQTKVSAVLPFFSFHTFCDSCEKKIIKRTIFCESCEKIISADHLSNCGAFYDSTSSGHVWNHFLFCDAADFPDEKVVLLSQIAQTRKCFCSFSVPPFTHFPVDALESAPRVVKNTDGADVVMHCYHCNGEIVSRCTEPNFVQEK